MSRNHYNIGPTRTAGPNRCGFCEQEWPCHGHRLEDEDMRAGRAVQDDGLDVERLRDLLNSLGIVGPTIRHSEWMKDDHMPEPWPGPGWCVCGRVMPCEAAAVGELLR